MPHFEIPQLITWGNARDWAPLPKRAWKYYREANGIPRPDTPAQGLAIDAAFRARYAQLAALDSEVRARLAEMEHDAATAELDAIVERADAERRAGDMAIRAARDARLTAMADNPGWQLIAGEHLQPIASGTRQDVYTRLSLVTGAALDIHGNGAWMIIAPDGTTAAHGKFDEHCYY